jgi:hypothetical protein
MNAKYPLRVHRRPEQRWAERFKSLCGRIIAAAERTLQDMFSNNGPLIPIPVKVVGRRRRLDRSQSQ